MSAVISRERANFHKLLVSQRTLVIDDAGVASNADTGNSFSKEVSLAVARSVGAEQGGEKLKGQRAGTQFEVAVQIFLQRTFPALSALRPGDWIVEHVGGSRKAYQLAKYEPYRHLADLAEAIKESPSLASILGNSYEIAPDVIVARRPEADDVINQPERVVDSTFARHSPIRLVNQAEAIAHAVVSCKWTLRSDRAQNARSEALNIIRNRKGRTPHIAVVTGECTAVRLASLALGTGDLDTVYHYALPELMAATEASSHTDSKDMLRTLIDGKRLRDISDLPLDLAV